MDFQQSFDIVRDSLTVRRVFGDPHTENGVTVIPVASLRGGAGGGQGQDKEQASGMGGGVGVMARPAGVYVIADGDVSWQPSLDVTKIVVGAEILLLVALLTVRTIAKMRGKSRS